MRRVLACLLILAAVTGSAAAQTAKPTRVIPATPRAAPAPAATPALPPPLVPLTGAPAQGVDSNQCRSSCARTYYFCRANSDDDSCATSWMQCKSRCTATYSPRALGN
ncbi:hypothetical protein [Caulobacter soli]|uniref:hypothetical protein n=1 Tax=Caulobacter soli TaxID=2708539 RepID=UPI0013ED40D5|nr:hypothetical protein [Caulobacter soli]